MEKIIIVGGGGHAKVLISIIKEIPKFNILGYVDMADKGRVLGAKYLGNDSKLAEIKRKHPNISAVIGIGSTGISEKRREIAQKLGLLKFSLPVIISPTAVVKESVRLGEGAVVLDGAVINVDATIGKCAIINSKVCIDHDCEIGDFVHVAPGATLCGGVAVRDNSFVGAGSTVIQYKTIGRDCLIAAGATVVKDCKAPGVYIGTPSRLKKKK